MISDHLSSHLPDNEAQSLNRAATTSSTGPKGVLADFKTQMGGIHFREQSSSTLFEYSNVPRIPHNISRVKDLNFNTFVPAIDDAPFTRTVIIHVYEPELSICHQMNDLLERLAINWNLKSCVFYKIQASELSSVMYFDPIALPALLVYVNQVQTHCLLRINDEIEQWREGRSQQLDYALEKYLEDESVL